jgi:hypothetical protein
MRWLRKAWAGEEHTPTFIGVMCFKMCQYFLFAPSIARGGGGHPGCLRARCHTRTPGEGRGRSPWWSRGTVTLMVVGHAAILGHRARGGGRYPDGRGAGVDSLMVVGGGGDHPDGRQSHSYTRTHWQGGLGLILANATDAFGKTRPTSWIIGKLRHVSSVCVFGVWRGYICWSYPNYVVVLTIDYHRVHFFQL